MSRAGVGNAHYRQGSSCDSRAARRRRGGYRSANAHGREPQPGLALLRLAQGNEDAAAAAMRRAVGEAVEPVDRAALLPAFVEIMLATGDLDEAERACAELEESRRPTRAERCPPRPRTRGERSAWRAATPARR